VSSLSTHVLDATNGRPAAGVPVRVERADGSTVAEALTDADGRVAKLAADLEAGTYRLVFDTGSYFQDTFYPEVAVTFRVDGPEQHYHVPLLLSPFAYSTYRGS
jgi:5-hydroxyisourate hydrolase